MSSSQESPVGYSRPNAIEAQEEKEKIRLRLVELLSNKIGDRHDWSGGISGLMVHRYTEPSEPRSYVMAPSICVILQGSKRVFLGDEDYLYDEKHFFVSSVDLPLIAQIIEASEERPYLAFTLELDQKAIAQFIMDEQIPSNAAENGKRAVAVDELPLPLIRALARLIELNDEPESIPALAPLFHKEILYRLMQTKPGPLVRQIGAAGSHTRQIAGTIKWIKENLDEKLSVEELARKAGMSNSTLHQHFKTLTALSPLQFQKRLRLNEARRMMLVDRTDAATAAFRVGYESPSQFSREYSRLFGAPPLKDIKKVKAG